MVGGVRASGQSLSRLVVESLIFQAWAEASGAYTPGKDKPDVSTWKRNFRSALNRKEVLRLAADNSKDPYDPHKVYEFVTPGACDKAGLGVTESLGSGGSLPPTRSLPLWTGARDFVHLGASPDTNGKSSLPHSQVRGSRPVPQPSPPPPTPQPFSRDLHSSTGWLPS